MSYLVHQSLAYARQLFPPLPIIRKQTRLKIAIRIYQISVIVLTLKVALEIYSCFKNKNHNYTRGCIRPLLLLGFSITDGNGFVYPPESNITELNEQTRDKPIKKA